MIGDTKVYQHSGATTDYEASSTNGAEERNSGGSYTVESATEQPCESTQTPTDTNASTEITAAQSDYPTEIADTPTVETIYSVKTTKYQADVTAAPYKPATPEPMIEAVTTNTPYMTLEPVYDVVTTQPPCETTEPVYTQRPYESTEPMY